MNKLPLHAFHEKHKVNYRILNDWATPAFYRGTESELRTARKKAGLSDLSFREKLFLQGDDALTFLQRLSTNDLSRLEALGALPTVFCDAHGKLIDYVQLFHFDEGILAVSKHYYPGELKTWLEQNILSEKVMVHDVTFDFLWLLLIGPKSTELIQTFVHQSILDDEIVRTETSKGFIAFLGYPYFRWPAFFVLVGGTQTRDLFNQLYNTLQADGTGLIGLDGFHVLRIEAGVPESRSEINNKFNPFEARLLHAVSFTKEAYLGQNAIALLDADDKVQKYIMVVELNGMPSERLPLKVFYEDEPIGTLTSYAYDPHKKIHWGLAFIRKQYAIVDLGLSVKCGTSGLRGELHLPISAKE